MADDQGQQEKTEEATPQKREDFRKQGQVAQTRELSSALVLFGVALLLWFMGRYIVELIFETYGVLYQATLLEAIKSGDIMPALKFAFGQVALFTFPILAILFLIGMASTLVQIGFLVTDEPIKFNINKINPLEGLKRLFSLKSVVEGIKAILKLSIVSLVIYLSLRGQALVLPKLMYGAPLQMLAFLSQLIFKTMLSIGAVMLVLAAFDYFFQRFDLEKKMKMSKQEVKEENKQREGDPLIKARIRKIQKDMASRRMMADVPRADVIITNPTHIAIALKYQPEKFAAPIMLAKGTDNVAKKIRELAKENNIPIVENKPLARTLFKSLEIGQVIPKELFSAVAEVLAYVFKLRRKGAQRG